MSKLNEKSQLGKRPSLDFTSGMGLANLLPPSFFLSAPPMGTFGEQQWANTGKKSPLLTNQGGNYQSYTFENEFPWQNPDVRKVLFPTRTSKLVDFLNTVGVNFVEGQNYADPDSETAQAIRDQALTEWGIANGDHTEAKDHLDATSSHLGELKALIKSQTTDLGKARKGEKDEIKRRGLNPLVKAVANLEKELADLAKQEKQANGLLAATQKKLDSGELTEEAGAKKLAAYQKKLTGIQEIIKPKKEDYDTKKGELDSQMPSIQADGNQIEHRLGKLGEEKAETELELESATSEEKFYADLEKKLDKIAHAKEITAEEVKAWAVHSYKKKIHSLGTDNIKDHDHVVGAVLELFAQDADGSKIPVWLRYATLHFTGMTYESAHGSWVDPKNLLKIIEEQNIRDASPEELAAMTDRAKADLTQRLEKAQADGDTKQVKRLTEQLENLARSGEAFDPESVIPSAAKGERRGLYEQLANMEMERAELNQLLGSGKGGQAEKDRLNQLDAEIKTFVKENKLSTAMHTNMQQKMAEQQESKLGALMDYNNQKIDGLEKADVLGLLMSMKSEIQAVGRNEWGELEPGQPDIWKEIVAYTQLKNDEAVGENWHSDFPERYQLAKATSDDPQVQRWLNILDEWRSGTKHQTGITAWRSEFNKNNEFVASSLVCNELAEHIQHLQGVKQRGGLNKNSVDYHRMGKEGGNAFFKHPTSKNDFPPGASLFWADWSAKKPAPANTVNLGALDGQTFYAPLTHEYKSSHAFKFFHFSGYRAKAMKDFRKELEAKMVAQNEGKKLDKAGKKMLDEQVKQQEKDWLAEYDKEWQRLKKEEHALHKPVPIPASEKSAAMDGWEYSFEGDILTKKKGETVLYLRWAHQSSIVEADDKRVRAYNTSGYSGQGMGITDHYSYGELTSDHNVFVGYAEGEVNEALKEDLQFEPGQYKSGMDLFAY